MKITAKYGDRIISIPASPVLEYLPKADADELKVLIYVLAEQNVTTEEIEKGTGVSKDSITSALFRWKELGVISCVGLKKSKASVENKGASSSDDCSAEKTDNNDERPRMLLSSELPSFTSDEINRFMEKHKEAKEVIDECQKILGRVFNVTESSTLVKFLDYYRLPKAYILLVCQRANDRLGTNVSMRYIEKEMVSLYDAGIMTYEELDEHYKTEKAARSIEGSFKKLIGAGSRTLSKKERGHLEKWVSFGFGFDMISLAYEITVNNTEKYSLDYMNAVIERWHDEGIDTPEQAQKASEKYKETPNTKKPSESKRKKAEEKSGSFDTDDFWNAALERSYGE